MSKLKAAEKQAKTNTRKNNSRRKTADRMASGGSGKATKIANKTTVKQNSKLTYRDAYRKYLNNQLKLKLYQKIGTIFLAVVLSGFIGWVWEFLLAEIEGGFQHLYIKGGNLLPWMNIYAYGALVIMLVSYKIRKYPWAVFVTSALATGLLELFAGWVVYEVGHGTRYWNYQNSWWGIGNINGFVCPASATVFGLSALALVYWLLPKLVYLSLKMKKRAFLTLSITLFTLIMIDDITNLTLKNLGLPTAQNLYEAMGWKFKP